MRCGRATRMTDKAVVWLLMPFSEAESLVHPERDWMCLVFQLYFDKQALQFWPLHPRFPFWNTGKSHPRALHSCVLRCPPHRLSFVILVSSLLLLSFGSNFLLLLFRVAKAFLLILLLSVLGSARKYETFHTQDDINNCRHCFASSF